jgi:hypothetical protein
MPVRCTGINTISVIDVVNINKLLKILKFYIYIDFILKFNYLFYTILFKKLILHDFDEKISIFIQVYFYFVR